ncbi:hypothetical protein SGFS_064710 [Streptomyces graminofaciens]|uniref:N-acetyltransferase domain-containing protein n=1 Tax=Streptomyces graminofaciens TaxID=68212 RepID=A0ABM7FFK6_9ACTN|nr:hypothetical protein SGFS_064710 [Streptomyces graminofaciens]
MTVRLSAAATPTAPALTLRPWRPDDAAALVVAHRDPGMRRWLVTHLDSEDDARRWVDEQSEGWASRTRLGFAVLEGAGRPVGHVVVKVVESSGGVAEVGYWTSAEVRGRGVAPRALDAVSAWALGGQGLLPLARLELFHASGNLASCRVAEKSRYVLHSVLPAQPPHFRTEGHLHVRRSAVVRRY